MSAGVELDDDALLAQLLAERKALDRQIRSVMERLGRVEPETHPRPLVEVVEEPERPLLLPAGTLAQQDLDLSPVRGMTEAELDRLPYGVVTLDARARVVGYSDTESRMMNLPPSKVLGRHWFTEVAPCTRVRDFEGRFQDVVSGRSRLGIETFDFVFRFASGDQRVTISILPARARGHYRVCILRRAA